MKLKLTAFKTQHSYQLRIQNISESRYFWKLKKKLDRDAISSLTRNSTTAKQITCTFTPNDLEISTNKISKSLNFSCGKFTAAKQRRKQLIPGEASRWQCRMQLRAVAKSFTITLCLIQPLRAKVAAMRSCTLYSVSGESRGFQHKDPSVEG